ARFERALLRLRARFLEGRGEHPFHAIPFRAERRLLILRHRVHLAERGLPLPLWAEELREPRLQRRLIGASDQFALPLRFERLQFFGRHSSPFCINSATAKTGYRCRRFVTGLATIPKGSESQPS